MPLKLVTGPANSGKAGRVLSAYRARVDDSLLVVPRWQDIAVIEREIAAAGVVFGARVVRFAWLFELIAERVGTASGSRRRVSELQRELILADVVHATRLATLARSAERAGFVHAATRFIGELERAMIDPERLRRATRLWADTPAARAYADELVAIYRSYWARLDAGALVDDDLYSWRALDALRMHPARWGRTRLFFHGFDDFTRLELDAIETLAGRADVEVLITLPYERGRMAFKAGSPVFQRLAAVAAEHTELAPSAEHYAESSRSPLHHLERRLFEAAAEPVEPADAIEDSGEATRPAPGEATRPAPGQAVRLFSAGGEHAEIELVGAEILRFLSEGIRPGEIAVIFRDPGRYASLVERVFVRYGIPFSLERSLPLARTALGRGLLALLRCAALDGTAEDLVTYLRCAGRVRNPQLADALEVELRRGGADSAEAARQLWQERLARPSLGEIDQLGRSSGSTSTFLRELERQLERLFARPYRRTAKVFSAEIADARAFTAAQATLADLRLGADTGTCPMLEPGRIHDILAATDVRVGMEPSSDLVEVASPETVRARRFDVVFVCGLQEGEFPRAVQPDPFFADHVRRQLGEGGDLPLPAREDELERERYLFYICASRAERTLVLSSRTSDEEGHPSTRSFLVDEVTRIFDDSLGKRARMRPLAQVGWPDEPAPTDAEWRRAAALEGPPRSVSGPDRLSAPELLAELAERRLFSARALETFADCPVKWFVEDVLRPRALEADAEPLVRGAYAHAVLELTYRRLRERTGAPGVTRENLAQAEKILVGALEELRSSFRLSPQGVRFRAAARRLEFDLVRFLRNEAEGDSGFQPLELELEFGAGEGGLPTVALEPEGIELRGKIDRVDVSGRHALVLDYKSGKTVFPVAKWKDRRRFQVPLYMIAVQELLGLEPVGGVYAPLAGDLPPRGLLSRDHRAELGSRFVATDFRDQERFGEHIREARQIAADTARRIRTGELRPCPETCAWSGGCSYPSICRQEP